MKTLNDVMCAEERYPNVAKVTIPLQQSVPHVLKLASNIQNNSKIRFRKYQRDCLINKKYIALFCLFLDHPLYLYSSAGHMITGNLNVIPDARVRNIISKGAKYRFPSNIDFPKCRREITASLNDFSNGWCKQENVEPDALKEWKINNFKIIDTRKPSLSERVIVDGHDSRTALHFGVKAKENQEKVPSLYWLPYLLTSYSC